MDGPRSSPGLPRLNLPKSGLNHYRHHRQSQGNSAARSACGRKPQPRNEKGLAWQRKNWDSFVRGCAKRPAKVREAATPRVGSSIECDDIRGRDEIGLS
jgi:hypothetical protein